MKYFFVFFISSTACLFAGNHVWAQEDWRHFSLDSIYRLADLETDVSDYENAKIKLDFLLAQAQIGEDLRWKAHSLMGYTCYFLGEYLESNSHYEQALGRHKAVGDSARMISTLRGIGMNFKNLGFFGLSLGKYLEALALASVYSNGQNGPHELYNSISLLYNSQKNYRKSLDYAKNAINSATMAGDSTILSFAYSNAAIAFHNLKQYDSSILFNRKALLLKTLLRQNSTIASNYNNLGLDFLDLGQYDRAQELFDSANYWYQVNRSREGDIIVNNNFGSLYLKINQLQKSRFHLELAEGLLHAIPNKRLLVDNLETQVLLFTELGDFKKAFEVQTKLADLKGAIFQEEELHTQRLEATFLLNEKENERKLLELDAELTRKEKSRITQLLFFIVAVAILLSILASNYFSLNKRLKSKNAIIEIQKTDIIHRTNNVLAKIRSVLKIIAFGFEGNEDKEKLMLAESVIISAGRLQDATYLPTETKAKINLGPYLENVAQQVLMTFQTDSKPIELKTTWREILSVQEEKALNIGIIVSELILNAVKYAFNAGTPKPTIHLTIESTGKNVQVKVSDNGSGIATEKSIGTGTDMVKKLVRHINAKLETNTGPTGTEITLTTTLQ